MSKIVFITKSLDANCFEFGSFATSSAAFEYGLVRALSKFVELEIIHLGDVCEESRLVRGLNFSSINYRSIFGFFWLAKEIISRIGGGEVKVLTTGYYPIEIGVVVAISKLFNIKSFCYIYDTHRCALPRMAAAKRCMADAYFMVGFFFAKMSAGLFVLNDAFIKADSIKTPYLKTKVGVNCFVENGDLCAENGCLVREKKIFVFAGTINSENGVTLLVEFLRECDKFNFEIHFYGDGEGSSIIRELSMIDDRVVYFGRISDSALQKKLIEADFLINLRDPEGISANYSFPSKLIKFMATGTPVISNRFPGLDSCYVSFIHLVDDYSVKALAKVMSSLLMLESDRAIGVGAKNFVNVNNDWNKISEELVKFME